MASHLDQTDMQICKSEDDIYNKYIIQPRREIQAFLKQLSELNSSKEQPDTLGVPNNLPSTELALTKDTVDECNWHFTDGIPKSACPDHHLHLEDVALRLSHGDDVT